MSGLCSDWITLADLGDCGCSTAPNPQVVSQSITTASQILYLLSGQQFPGECTDIVRPCNCHGCGGLPVPMHFPSGWRNVCGGCGGYCGAGGASILLPNRPVISVEEVTIDGEPFTDFRLDSPGWLIRTDGGDWPSCQDITLDTTEAGTWEVSYTYGKVPPTALRFAAVVFATELVKACQGETTCRIPAGAVSMQRQGITYDFDIGLGKIGLFEVDRVIEAFNRHGVARRARVYSPDDLTWSRPTIP